MCVGVLVNDRVLAEKHHTSWNIREVCVNIYIYIYIGIYLVLWCRVVVVAVGRTEILCGQTNLFGVYFVAIRIDDRITSCVMAIRVDRIFVFLFCGWQGIYTLL